MTTTMSVSVRPPSASAIASSVSGCSVRKTCQSVAPANELADGQADEDRGGPEDLVRKRNEEPGEDSEHGGDDQDHPGPLHGLTMGPPRASAAPRDGVLHGYAAGLPSAGSVTGHGHSHRVQGVGGAIRPG